MIERRLYPIVACLVFVLASPLHAYENCNGIGYFALQVPDPSAMTPDGKVADWDWFDPDFIIGPEQMCETLGGLMPSLDDLDLAIRLAWTPEPDNRFYALVIVVDDTLNLNETELDSYWNDDDLEIVVDANHGSWAEAADALRVDHQQFGFHIPGEGRGAEVASVRFLQPPEMQWPVTEGAIEAEVVVTPQAVHGATNTTAIYEVRMWTWDQLRPGGAEASTRHMLTANETIGLSVSYNEADTAGRTHQVSTHVNSAGAHESEFTSEAILLTAGDFRSSAVESNSWGAVKALLR